MEAHAGVPDPALPIRVLVVDDHQVVIDGLRAIMAQEDGIDIVAEAHDGLQALELVKSFKPDVVIMDVSMPRMDGIEATRAICKGKHSPRVLALTMYNNVEFVQEMLDAGASGFVLKNTGRSELREAILAVHQGRRYLSAPVEAAMAAAQEGTSDGAPRPVVTLSKREKEVVLHLVAGRNLAQIADAMHLSEATVSTHRKNIYHKLGIHSLALLVKYALERGWGPPPGTVG